MPNWGKSGFYDGQNFYGVDGEGIIDEVESY